MIQKLKDLQNELKALRDENATLKTEVEGSKEEIVKSLEDKIEALKKEMEEAMTERKSLEGDEVNVSDKDVEVATKGLIDLKLKSVVAGKDITSYPEYKGHKEVIEKALKPADVPNWIDEVFSRDVKEKVELELKVAGLFRRVTVPKGAQSLSIPTRTANLTAYLIQPAADAIESVIADGKVTFTPEKLKTLSIIANPEDDEIVTSVIDMTKQELAKSLSRGLEQLIIQGDTAIANANDIRKIDDGLLKLGVANAIDQGGTDLTLDKVNEARTTMGVLGVYPQDLAIVVSPKTFIKLAKLEEFRTADKFGNTNSTNHTGVVGQLEGIEVYVSEYLPEDLTAAGVNDGSGNTTAAIVVHKDSFMIGDKVDNMLSESDRNIINDTLIFTASMRTSFKQVSITGEKSVVAIVNVAV
jgi:HK97 family phage major capsid protein